MTMASLLFNLNWSWIIDNFPCLRLFVSCSLIDSFSSSPFFPRLWQYEENSAKHKPDEKWVDLLLFCFLSVVVVFRFYMEAWTWFCVAVWLYGGSEWNRDWWRDSTCNSFSHRSNWSSTKVSQSLPESTFRRGFPKKERIIVPYVVSCSPFSPRFLLDCLSLCLPTSIPSESVSARANIQKGTWMDCKNDFQLSKRE